MITATKYYSIAGMRVAVDEGTLYYLASDPMLLNLEIEAKLRLNKNWCFSQF
ncbi:MAG: hypothetical protein ABFS17_07905 [Chloroflexota bacterium]